MATALQKLQKLSRDIDKPLSKEEKFVGSIQALADVINNQMNLEEAAEAVKQILDLAVQHKQQAEAETEKLREATNKIMEALEKEATSINGQTKEDVRQMIGEIKAEVDRRLNASLGQLDGKFGRLEKEHRQGMALISDKLDSIKDGEPGKDADEGKIKEEVESQIKPLEEEIESLKKRPVARGGGTTAMQVRQMFKYISHTEQPSGAIDGANKEYTVNNTIWFVAGFTLNGETIAELPNYTIAGNKITFTEAIPAAFSGKDFECKYIG